MPIYQYNSYHKLIVVMILIGWSVYHFFQQTEQTTNYPNGQIRKTGLTLNGKNHGKWVWYYPSGQVKMEGYFEHGKRIGQWHTYSIEGQKLTQSTYKDDQLNGQYIKWNENEKVLEKHYYQFDQKIINETTQN